MRTVLRYKLEPDNDGLSAIKVGAYPVVVHVGTGTSPTVCAWVEVDTDTADVAILRFASVGTGQTLPKDAGMYVGFVIEPCATGMAIRHYYRLEY